MKLILTCIIEKEGDGYVSLCLDLDIASQGDTIAEARANLIESLELFFEYAPEEEVKRRLRERMYTRPIAVSSMRSRRSRRLSEESYFAPIEVAYS